MEYFFQKCSWHQFLNMQVYGSTVACLKPKNAYWTLSIAKARKTKIMEFLFQKCSWKLMDTISHTSLVGKFYIHQENNTLFMTKNVNFAFFPWTLLGYSKKTLTYKVDFYSDDLYFNDFTLISVFWFVHFTVAVKLVSLQPYGHKYSSFKTANAFSQPLITNKNSSQPLAATQNLDPASNR